MQILSSIVSLGLLGFVVSGCVVESVDDAGLEGAVSESTPRAGSAAYNEAVQIIDDTLSLMVDTPNPDIPWMLSMFADQADAIDFAALDAEERAALSAYFVNEASTDEVELVLMSMQNQGVPFDESFDEPAPDDGLCGTKCVLFTKRDCITNEFVGLCFWPKGCGAGESASECADANPPDSCGGLECAEDERCARWVFQAHECVTTCNSDADCSGTEQCKKPAGTAFKRCK